MKKGVISKAWIIEESVKILNSKGIDLTLNQLASNLGISRGRINHFFNTKDALFIAISNDYEEKLKQINEEYNLITKELTFQSIRDRFSLIMNHQYNYRCAILYISCFSNSDLEMREHIKETYRNNKEKIYALLQGMVKLDLLNDDILEEENFQLFNFQLVNLFTTWVIHFEIYDKKEGFEKIKPIYLEGIMQCFDRYKK